MLVKCSCRIRWSRRDDLFDQYTIDHRQVAIVLKRPKNRKISCSSRRTEGRRPCAVVLSRQRSINYLDVGGHRSFYLNTCCLLAQLIPFCLHFKKSRPPKCLSVMAAERQFLMSFCCKLHLTWSGMHLAYDAPYAEKTSTQHPLALWKTVNPTAKRTTKSKYG